MNIYSKCHWFCLKNFKSGNLRWNLSLKCLWKFYKCSDLRSGMIKLWTGKDKVQQFLQCFKNLQVILKLINLLKLKSCLTEWQRDWETRGERERGERCFHGGGRFRLTKLDSLALYISSMTVLDKKISSCFGRQRFGDFICFSEF